MKDSTCVEFLQWALPRLRMRWPGFRKVRNQVCKRIDRRVADLGLAGVDAYRDRLLQEDEEWEVLDEMCRITISRFYRDARVFERLVHDVLPALAGGRDALACWSAGCASGEEPYTLAVCRQEMSEGASDVPLYIVATDVNPHMLDRASKGCYQRGTLKELPDELIEQAFRRTGTDPEPYCIGDAYRKKISWMQHDVRDEPPEGPFDLILCRNLVFTYFDDDLQEECLKNLLSVLRRGGAIVIGKHEDLPPGHPLVPWYENERIFRRE